MKIHNRPQLFKGWMHYPLDKSLSSGLGMTKQSSYGIHWIVIYQVDSVIHALNNQAQDYDTFSHSFNHLKNIYCNKK